MKRKIFIFILVLSAMGTSVVGCASESAKEDKTEVISEVINEEVVSEEDSAMAIGEKKEEQSDEEKEPDNAEKRPEDSVETASEEEPEYSVSNMDKVMYAQRSVNVRSGPSTNYEKLGVLITNQVVKVTGQADTGWYQIDYGGKEGFVSNNYLGDKEVVVAQNNVPNEENELSSTASAVDTTGLPSKVLCGETRYVLRTTANGTPIYDCVDWQWPQYIVDIINECCTPDMNDLQKAQAIHDWMATNISYNLETYNHTTYSTLMYREAVCCGYAFAYQSLCYCVGIEASVVDGSCFNSKDEFIGLHSWNFIYIDGVKYHVDATWHMGPSSLISFTPYGENGYRVDFYKEDGTSLGHYRTMTVEDFYGHFDNLYSEKGVVYY